MTIWQVVPRSIGTTLLIWSSVAAGSETRAWIDRFSAGTLDSDRWVVTAQGDFREHTADVVPDGRLRLRADTIGTRDDTVKYLGVRSRRAFPVGDSLCVAATLDWNDQSNGSYLSVALVLAGEETTANPMDERNWVAVEYVGVPPGRHARGLVSASSERRRVTLANEGWPRRNREGREIALVRIFIRIGPHGLEVRENGERRYWSRRFEAPFARAFLHLQLSSHSNYPAREIYFDDVEVNDCSDDGSSLSIGQSLAALPDGPLCRRSPRK